MDRSTKALHIMLSNDKRIDVPTRELLEDAIDAIDGIDYEALTKAANHVPTNAFLPMVNVTHGRKTVLGGVKCDVQAMYENAETDSDQQRIADIGAGLDAARVFNDARKCEIGGDLQDAMYIIAGQVAAFTGTWNKRAQASLTSRRNPGSLGMLTDEFTGRAKWCALEATKAHELAAKRAERAG